MKKYETIYVDKFGVEKSKFKTNGSKLTIELRGIEFSGSCFESLKGKINKEKFDYEEFRNENKTGDLTNCEFDVEIPIKIKGTEWTNEGVIKASIKTGEKYIREKKYGIQLTLITKFGNFSNAERYGWFEDALIDIQNQLPNNVKMKICLSCKYSHYFPGGNGMYGGLNCFKKIKGKANEIRNKESLFRVLGMAKGKIFSVQETFDCEEHEFITESDWNYSNWQ